MISHPGLRALSGRWQGENKLWVRPREGASRSESTAEISLILNGRMLLMRYTWADAGRPQDGVLLLSEVDKQGAIEADWADSWHMGDRSMQLSGRLEADTASCVGYYPAPPGPDWGWRITVRPLSADAFEFSMDNITPDGISERAVLATYSRLP